MKPPFESDMPMPFSNNHWGEDRHVCRGYARGIRESAFATVRPVPCFRLGVVNPPLNPMVVAWGQRLYRMAEQLRSIMTPRGV